MPLREQVRDATGQDSRLARACTGDDEQRPPLVHDGRALLGVEIGKELFGLR